jgi:hypothetical protein
MAVIKDPENTTFNTADQLTISGQAMSDFFIGWAIK